MAQSINCFFIVFSKFVLKKLKQPFRLVLGNGCRCTLVLYMTSSKARIYIFKLQKFDFYVFGKIFQSLVLSKFKKLLNGFYNFQRAHFPYPFTCKYICICYNSVEKLLYNCDRNLCDTQLSFSSVPQLHATKKLAT